MPRAGTTTLNAHLRGLDDVFLPAVKEPHFFTLRHGRGLDWYSGLYSDARPDQVCGDITPSYLVHPRAVPEMARLLPQARVVVVLRDPVARAYSHYWLNQWKGVERGTFEEAIAAEPRRLAADPGAVQYAYLRSGHYGRLLHTLYDHYPAEQVMVVVFDDLVAAPSEVLTAVCQHVGASTGVVEAERRRVNHHGPVRSVWLSTLARHLPGPACRAVRRWNTSTGEYPEISPTTRSRLVGGFADDHDVLTSLLNRSLPWG